jgi:hypothetical protein
MLHLFLGPFGLLSFNPNYLSSFSLTNNFGRWYGVVYMLINNAEIGLCQMEVYYEWIPETSEVF